MTLFYILHIYCLWPQEVITESLILIWNGSVLVGSEEQEIRNAVKTSLFLKLKVQHWDVQTSEKYPDSNDHDVGERSMSLTSMFAPSIDDIKYVDMHDIDLSHLNFSISGLKYTFLNDFLFFNKM